MIISLEHFRRHGAIQLIEALQVKADPENIAEWSYDNLLDKIEARYGENTPKALKRLRTETFDEPYVGDCVHGCIWSSAPSTDGFAFPARMNQDVAVVGKAVEKGGMDPLHWMDRKYENTLHWIMSRRGKKVEIHTRSDLVAHDDYIGPILEAKSKVFLYFTVTDDQIQRVMQPGCPSQKRQITAYKRLQEFGVNVEPVFIFIKGHSKLGQLSALNRELGCPFSKAKVREVKLTAALKRRFTRAGIEYST